MRSRAFSTRRTALWQNLSGLWPQSFPAPLRLRLCHDLAELYRVAFEGDLLLNFLPPESPIIDTRRAEEQFRNLKIAPLYFQPNFRRESAGRKPTQHRHEIHWSAVCSRRPLADDFWSIPFSSRKPCEEGESPHRVRAKKRLPLGESFYLASPGQFWAGATEGSHTEKSYGRFVGYRRY